MSVGLVAIAVSGLPHRYQERNKAESYMLSVSLKKRKGCNGYTR